LSVINAVSEPEKKPDSKIRKKRMANSVAVDSSFKKRGLLLRVLFDYV